MKTSKPVSYTHLAKCVAFDDHGAQLALSYIEYPNPPGKANLEPQVLSDSVVRVIRDCVQALPARDAVAAITVSSFGESFVPIDEHGAPLTDIIMYFANSGSCLLYTSIHAGTFISN